MVRQYHVHCTRLISMVRWVSEKVVIVVKNDACKLQND